MPEKMVIGDGIPGPKQGMSAQVSDVERVWIKYVNQMWVDLYDAEKRISELEQTIRRLMDRILEMDERRRS